MNLAKNLRKYFRRRFRVLKKGRDSLMKLVREILVVLLVVLFGTFGWSAPKTIITMQDYQPFELPGSFETAIKKYESLNPDVEIKHYFVPYGELVKKLITQSLTESLPDILFANNPEVLYLANAGVFKDITPLVNEWEGWKDFYPGSKLAVTFEGKVYAILKGTNNLALWYNKDYFEKAGIDAPPETWDDILKASQKLKGILEEGVYPIGFCASNIESCTWQFLPFLWSNNGSLLALDSPEAIEALELWTTLVKEEYAPRDVLNWSQGDITQYFKDKKLAMMIQGNWELSVARIEDFKKSGLVSGTNFDIVPIPVSKKGLKRIVPAGGECFALSANIDPQKEKIAWDFIKFYCDSQNMSDFGVESGYVPTRAAATEILIAERPDLKPFADQAKNAVTRSAAGGGEKYVDISAITRSAIQQALSGALSPADAFKQAAGKIKALYKTEEEYERALSEAASVLLQAKK